MSKEYVLMRDIVCKFLPGYRRGAQRAHALANPSHYNVEHLVELAMAHVGGYSFVDGELFDFSDGTECKTASIAPTLASRQVDSFAGNIPSIMTTSGGVKKGHIRSVIYNPHLDELKYVFLPKDVWDPHMREWGDANKRRIRFSWNRATDRIKKFDGYMCKDFVELAQK
jgi:hypothetical protein